ncbi:MAG: hypothetical protein DMF69_22455 [Acidobacteria bacterium]|nr:MAG: hypothetical protein DMF69_22455 [Acidobacteriota bacterium]
MVCLVLESNDFDVRTAGTLEDGIRLAQEEVFDLYLLDMWLPDGVGLELARIVRKSDCATPIVFFSAAAYESDHSDALAAGAQAYLIKPINPTELCDVISTLIESPEIARTAKRVSVA